MSQSKAASDSLTLADCTLVDMDSHVGERLVEDLLPHMESEGVKRRLEALDPAAARHKIYSSTRTTPEFAQTTTSSERWGNGLVHANARDPSKKLEYMDEFGIEYSVLTPGLNLGLASVNHDQTAVEIAGAYNAWMAETFYGVSDRLRSTILVAHQKPERAAEEIDRWAGEEDAAGVQLPASGLIPPAGHGWYDPIYEAAQDHGLPILMHTGNSTSTAAFPVQRNWAETFIEDHFFTFPIEGIWHLNSMLFQGVPERFPDLRFVVQETGVEWLPWLMWRMDDHYLQNSEDVPILTRTPSEYIREQFHFTTQPLGHTGNTRQLGSILEFAGGPETVMFATDHPHPDFDTPEELFTPLRTNENFSDDDVRAIMGESAIDLFGLG